MGVKSGSRCGEFGRAILSAASVEMEAVKAPDQMPKTSRTALREGLAAWRLKLHWHYSKGARLPTSGWSGRDRTGTDRREV